MFATVNEVIASTVPPLISNAVPSISTEPASSFLPRVIFSPPLFAVLNVKYALPASSIINALA